MTEYDDYLPLSGLQHLIFCERQCALIHVEQVWAENPLTLSGRLLHANADRPGDNLEDGQRVIRALDLYSHRLRIVGKADVVEFRLSPDGRSVPYPVEYKHGQKDKWGADGVQLCAQALCLEEMFRCEVPEGAIFYRGSRRRTVVIFDAALRERTVAAAEQFHDLFKRGVTPQVPKQPKCRQCSLLDICLPASTYDRQASGTYLTSLLKENEV